jgi:hypothetical protein
VVLLLVAQTEADPFVASKKWQDFQDQALATGVAVFLVHDQVKATAVPFGLLPTLKCMFL